jgi:hypothetical protein
MRRPILVKRIPDPGRELKHIAPLVQPGKRSNPVCLSRDLTERVTEEFVSLAPLARDPKVTPTNL